MAYFTINGKRINYDESLCYESIGVVGSGPGGAIFDTFPLDPRSFFGNKGGHRRRVSGDELTRDLGLITSFLETGIFEGDNGTRNLSDDERPAFERTAELYREVLSALKGK